MVATERQGNGGGWMMVETGCGEGIAATRSEWGDVTWVAGFGSGGYVVAVVIRAAKIGDDGGNDAGKSRASH